MATQSHTISSTMTTVWLFLVWSICILKFLNQVYADKPRDDLEVLALFMNSSSNDYNGCMTKWNVNNTNACSWEHIKCDSGSRITEIDLGGCYIIGRVIPEFGQLENLISLDLHSNGLGFYIPPEFGNLVNLRVLNLSDNFFLGNIPKELGKLLKLRSLELQNNNLYGKVPDKLAVLFKDMDLVDLTKNKAMYGDLEGPCTRNRCTHGSGF